MKKRFCFRAFKWILFYALVPLSFYPILLHIPWVRNIGAFIRYSFDLRLLAVGVLIYLCFRIHGLWGGLLSYWSIQLLFAVSLVGLWWNAFSEYQVLGGGLFFSDAFRYYGDAQLLLSGHPFTSFSTRHPLGPGFLSFLLWITGNNLQLALVILTVITAGCIAFSAEEVKRSVGSAAAAVYLMICFLFYRRFTGLIDTENLGTATAALGFLFLWHSSSARRPLLCSTGLFLMVTSLIIRPGPLLIIPGIAFWFYQKNKEAYSKWLVLIIGVSAVILPILMQTFVTFSAGDQHGAPFSNYAYTLYGIASGGKGWEQFLKDEPETVGLPEPEIEKIAFTRAVEKIKGSPGVAIFAAGKAIGDFFGVRDESAFGFIAGGEVTARGLADPQRQKVYQICRGCFWAMAILGIVALLKSRKQGMSKLLIYALPGIVLSVPFLPPQDAGIMRVYASAIPFLAILPALGFSRALHETSFAANHVDGEDHEEPLKPLAGIALFLALVLTFAPAVEKYSTAKETIEPIYCSPGFTPVDFQVFQGSYLRITDNNDGTTRVPQVTKMVFLERLRQFPHYQVVASLEQTRENTVFLNAINLYNNQLLWIVIPQFKSQLIGKEIAACGVWDRALFKNGLGFLTVAPGQIREVK
ncbi:MAG TPA: hypothetical protein VHO90_15665 [Bacteroidales bacterium]|nr:hypothetical protein [Bacteroidales bacterium]